MLGRWIQASFGPQVFTKTLPILFCATILLSPTSLVAAQISPIKAKHSLHDPTFNPELLSRLRALEHAKTNFNPLAVAESARLFIASALRDSADLHLRQREVVEAIDDLKTSLTFEDVSAARIDLTVAYLTTKSADEALATATDLLTRDPENAYAWYLQGQSLMMKKSYEAAVASFSHAVQLDTNPRWSFSLGAALLQTHQLEAAQARFKDVLQQKGENALVHVRLSQAYRNALYPAEAAREMQAARRLDPKISTSVLRGLENNDLIALQYGSSAPGTPSTA